MGVRLVVLPRGGWREGRVGDALLERLEGGSEIGVNRELILAGRIMRDAGRGSKQRRN